MAWLAVATGKFSALARTPGNGSTEWRIHKASTTAAMLPSKALIEVGVPPEPSISALRTRYGSNAVTMRAPTSWARRRVRIDRFVIERMGTE